MSNFLDYPGLEHYTEKMLGRISQLGLEVNGLSNPFEAGSINYLTGEDGTDTRCVRTGHIPISGDTIINMTLGKTIYGYYLIKYLNGSYVGYTFTQAAVSSAQVEVTADSTFNTIRLRIQGNEAWTEEQIANSSYSAYIQGSAYERVGQLDSAINGVAGHFKAGSINFLNGVDATDDRCLRTDNIPISEDTIINMVFGKKIYGYYLVKYLNGIYAGYTWTRAEVTSTQIKIIADSTFDTVRFRIQGNEAWTEEQIANSSYNIVGMDESVRDILNIVSNDTSHAKYYEIGNHDNDFVFDEAFIGRLISAIIQLRPNFELPSEGAYISTDVEYTGVRTSPITDTQLLRAFAPYLYINGEKRGTVVLFDENGTPFIYDQSGNKRIINIS